MSKSARWSQSLFHDDEGAFAPAFALMAFALIALIGTGIDFARLMSARQHAQSLLDQTALALTGSGSASISWALDISSGLEHEIAQYLGPGGLAYVSVSDRLDGAGGLYLSVAMTFPSYFVGLVGVPELTVRVVSVARPMLMNPTENLRLSE